MDAATKQTQTQQVTSKTQDNLPKFSFSLLLIAALLHGLDGIMKFLSLLGSINELINVRVLGLKPKQLQQDKP